MWTENSQNNQESKSPHNQESKNKNNDKVTFLSVRLTNIFLKTNTEKGLETDFHIHCYLEYKLSQLFSCSFLNYWDTTENTLNYWEYIKIYSMYGTVLTSPWSHITTIIIKIQNNSITPKNSFIFFIITPFLYFQPLKNHWFIFCAFSRVLSKWNHTIWSFFSLASFTLHMHLRFIHTVALSVVYAFLLLDNIPLYGCTTLCLSITS